MRHTEEVQGWLGVKRDLLLREQLGLRAQTVKQVSVLSLPTAGLQLSHPSVVKEMH